MKTWYTHSTRSNWLRVKQRLGQQDAQQECRVIHPCPGTVFKAYHLQIHTRIHLGLKDLKQCLISLSRIPQKRYPSLKKT